MRISADFTWPTQMAADWLIVPVFEDAGLSALARAVDSALDGALTRLRESGDAAGKANELTPLLHVPGIASRRILVVGLGKRDEVDRPALLTAAGPAARHVTGKQIDRLGFLLPDDVPGVSAEYVALMIGVGLFQGSQGPGLRKNKKAFRPVRFTSPRTHRWTPRRSSAAFAGRASKAKPWRWRVNSSIRPPA